jgi:phage FluMu protein Com
MNFADLDQEKRACVMKLFKSGWPKEIRCRVCDSVFLADKADAQPATCTKILLCRWEYEFETLAVTCPECSQPNEVRP